MKTHIFEIMKTQIHKGLFYTILFFASVLSEVGIFLAISPLWNVFSETYPPSTPLVLIITYHVLPMFLILIAFFIALFILPAIAINSMECLTKKERGDKND